MSYFAGPDFMFHGLLIYQLLVCSNYFYSIHVVSFYPWFYLEFFLETAVEFYQMPFQHFLNIKTVFLT